MDLLGDYDEGDDEVGSASSSSSSSSSRSSSCAAAPPPPLVRLTAASSSDASVSSSSSVRIFAELPAASSRARSAASRLFGRAASASAAQAAAARADASDYAEPGHDEAADAGPSVAGIAEAADSFPLPLPQQQRNYVEPFGRSFGVVGPPSFFQVGAGLAFSGPEVAGLDEGPALHLDKRMRRELGLDGFGGGGVSGDGGGGDGRSVTVDASALRGDWQQTLAQQADQATAAAAAEGAKRGGKSGVHGKIWSSAAGAAVVSKDVSRLGKSRNAIQSVAAAALASQAAVGAASAHGQKTKAQTWSRYGW